MKYSDILIIAVTLMLLSSLASAYDSVRFVSEFGGKGEGPGKFSEKIRLAFDKSDNIYILDTENLCIQKLNSDGKPIMEISSGLEVILSRPMDIAIDREQNIYVTDWKAIQISGTEFPKIFNYGVCIHKFSRDGKFITDFTLENLTLKSVEVEKAVPAIDTDGNFALMILPEHRDRQLYISIDDAGNIYVLDQDKIYKLNPDGDVLLTFASSGGGKGQLDKPTGITIDSEGNIYIADTGNHRISKFSPDGRFLLSFGKEGDTDGCFSGELYVIAASDGTILVGDSARYEKIFKTSLEHRKLVESSILVTGQDDPLIPRRREFKKVIRRFQRFDANGKFREKILYRIDKSDPELRNMEFVAIDPKANLYLMDKDRIVICKYAIDEPFRWSEVEKTFTYRFLHSESKLQIDNFYDLDEVFDFDESESYTQMTAILRLNYDVTETFRVSLTNSLIRLNGKTTDTYPGEYADPYGFIQDDITTDKYIAGRIRLDLSLVLNHDPFKYRVGDLFVYFGGGRYDYDIDAIDIQNERKLDENLWWAVWAAGARYDVGESLRISLIATQHRPMGFMNYDYIYWDERGELYSTGLGRGVSTDIFVSVSGAF